MPPSMLLHICTKSGRENTFLPIVFPNNVHIQMCSDNNIAQTVRIIKLVAELSPENEYGITLVSLDESFRQEMEPNTAPFDERIRALRALHDAGCKTWVSMEPYPTPNFIEQDLEEILEAIAFCDKIIFGRLNYNKKVSEYKGYKQFFNVCAQEVIAFCKRTGKDYHIKDGTISNE